MKTARKTSEKPNSHAVKPAFEQENGQSDPENGSESTRKSFSFYVDADGKILFDKMQDRTKRELKEFLERPELSNFFKPPSVDAKPVEIFAPESVDMLYLVLGKIEIELAAGMWHVHRESAEAALTYTQAEREMLRKPTVKVLNKYVSKWMIKYQDEIALTMMLVSITMAKLRFLQALESRRKGPEPIPINAKREEPEPEPPPVPN